MSNLIEYITTHTGFAEDGSDVVFFKVKAINDANSTDLIAAIRAHVGKFCECNPLDGKEHNYLELGGWIGDQGLALRLIGLGADLGAWDLLTPRTVLGDAVDSELAQQLAGMGMVSMQVKE